MKTKMYIAVALLSCSFLANSALALDIANSAGGGTVTVTPANTSHEPIVFNPSTKVRIDGESSALTYGMGGWHEQAVGKEQGQAYGAAEDTNKTYWITTKASAPTIGTLGTQGSALFSSWNTM